MVRGYVTRSLDPEPLRALVQRRERAAYGDGWGSTQQCGRQELARDIASQTGQEPKSVARVLHRLMHERATGVSPHIADRLCIGMGVHPAEVYGDDWWSLPCTAREPEGAF